MTTAVADADDITANDVLAWLAPYEVPPERAAEVATFLNEAVADPPVRPAEALEVEVARFRLRRLRSMQRAVEESLTKLPVGSPLAIFRASQLPRLAAEIEALKARLPARANATTFEWSMYSFATHTLATRVLAEAGCQARRNNAAAMRFTQKAVGKVGFTHSDRSVEREVKKLRRACQNALSHLSDRQEKPGQ